MIDTELRAAGLHMVVAFGVDLGDARRQAIDGIEFLMERGCDGLIVMTSALQEGDIAALGVRQSQRMVLNHAYASIPDQCFTADHALGGRLAARADRVQAPRYCRRRRAGQLGRQCRAHRWLYGRAERQWDRHSQDVGRRK